MKNCVAKALAIFVIFFIGTYSLGIVDNICLETTGRGGKLVFNVEKLGLFN